MSNCPENIKWNVNLFFPTRMPERMKKELDFPSDKMKWKDAVVISPLFVYVDFDLGKYPSQQHGNDTVVGKYRKEMLLVIKDMLGRFDWQVKDIFYPYGAIISGKLQSTQVKSWIKNFNAKFSTSKSEKESSKIELLEYPIILFSTEANNCEDGNDRLRLLSEYFSFETNDIAFTERKRGTIFWANPCAVIFYKSDLLVEDLTKVVKIHTAIRGIAGEVKNQVSKKISGEHKGLEDILAKDLSKINKKCAVVPEIENSTIFYDYNQKVLFEDAKRYFRSNEIVEQIKSVQFAIEHTAELKSNLETKGLNKIAFLFGSLSIIFAVFSFVPLNIVKEPAIIFENGKLIGEAKVITLIIAVISLIICCCVLYSCSQENRITCWIKKKLFPQSDTLGLFVTMILMLITILVITIIFLVAYQGVCI